MTTAHNLLLGSLLTAHREQAHLGIREFADLCDMPVTYLQGIEYGTCTPRDTDFARLATGLAALGHGHLTADYLAAVLGRLAPDIQEMISQAPERMVEIAAQLRSHTTEAGPA